MVTRRDQLSIKRPPPSKRSKGRGKGKGKGGKGKSGKGKKGKGKCSSSKSPTTTTTKESKAKKNKEVSQHDVEDEEVSEDYGKGSETVRPAKVKASCGIGKAKAKAKAKASAKRQEKTETKSEPNKKKMKPANAPKADSMTEIPNDEHQIEESTSRIMEYVKKIDFGLDGDSFKNACRQFVPDLGQGQLNIYWTKHTCGLRWRIGRTSQDVHCFGFKKGFPGTPSLKQAVAIGTSIELVTWQVFTKSSFGSHLALSLILGIWKVLAFADSTYNARLL